MSDDVKPVPESALVPEPKPTNWLRIAATALMFGGWAIAAFLAYRSGGTIPPPPTLIVGETMQTGWRNDPEAVEAIRQGLPEPWFAGTPAGRAVQGNENETVLLSDFVKEFTGGHLPARNQLDVGSCVSFGTCAAIERLFCVQAVEAKRAGRPPPTEFRELCQEVMYAGSRVEVGGGKIRGDGSVTAWAAQFARDWGVVPRDKYGPFDLTKYSPTRCREWGRTGVPAEIEIVAKLSPVKGITFARSFAEVAKAIRNGYPLAIGSSVGFGNRGPYVRDADGFLTANGSWGHCMAITGVVAGKRPGAMFVNSWGADWISGPMGGFDMPPGSFFVDEKTVDRMAREGDCVVFSDAVGFPPKALDWFAGVRPRNPNPVAAKGR